MMGAESRARTPFLFALATFFVVVVAFLYGWQYFRGQVAEGNFEALLVPGSTLPESFLLYMLAAGLLAALLVAIIAFLLLAAGQRAGRIAQSITEDLLSSRELFLKLYEHSPVPYVLLSHKGTITFPNKAALRLFGVTQEKLEGKQLFDLISGEDEKHMELLPVQYRQGASISDEEVCISTPEGKMRWAELSVFPFNQSGRRHNGLVALVDVTRRKEIDRAKTEFVSLASHQLRTPISLIKWHTELLSTGRAGTLSGVQRKEVEVIERGISRMDAIVDDFLNASRLELGTLTAELQTVRLPELVDSLLEEHRAHIGEKHLSVHTHCEVEHVRTDQRLLRMVLGNIVANAVKYTQASGEVRISAKQEAGMVEVAVADTGMGIPADEQDKLFTKMFRGSNVRGAVPDGTGLGLYIAKLALDVLGGTATFTSREGEGTTFIVKLPA